MLCNIGYTHYELSESLSETCVVELYKPCEIQNLRQGENNMFKLYHII